MILDPVAKTWTEVGTTQVPFGAWTSFAPGKYLITGGSPAFFPAGSPQGAPSQRIAKVLDMTSGSPVWTNVPDMVEPRSFHNVTMLPTGKAMVIGGSHIVQDSVAAERRGVLLTDLGPGDQHLVADGDDVAAAHVPLGVDAAARWSGAVGRRRPSEPGR